MSRFSKIDTIKTENIKDADIISIRQLTARGKKIFLKVSEEKNLFIETYNEIFEYIYVLEKISDCKYKRTRFGG